MPDFRTAGNTNLLHFPDEVLGRRLQIICPVSCGVPFPHVESLSHPKFGQATDIWMKRNADGGLLGSGQVRFEGPNGKEPRPISRACLPAEPGMWVCLDLEPTPRALFGLDALTAKPKARVLIVEGPKTREVAAERFPGWAVVCAGGATGAAKFDWSPMRERRVTIWPDNDDPGLRCQEKVARLCLTAGAKEVRCIILPEGLPKGWDLADEAPEGWRLEEILDDAPEYRSDAFRYREAEDPPTDTSVVEFSDDFLALDFSSENADELRYCDQFGKWYCWDGTVWAEDIKRAVFTRARLVCRRHAPKARKLSAKLAREVSAARAVAAIVNLARADVRHVTIAADWDANPWSLNTPGGIVDLHTGEMHEHDRSELHSKITAVAPSKSPCHRWTNFLERITNNDEPLQKFLPGGTGVENSSQHSDGW